MKRKTPSSSEITNIWKKAFGLVDNALSSVGVVAEGRTEVFLDQWIKYMTHPALPSRPFRREPADGAQIKQVEVRLGLELPAQVRDLYKSTNGLEWVKSEGEAMAHGGHFPRLEELSLAAALNPPLSVRCLQHWLKYRSADEPKTIELHKPSIFAYLYKPLAIVSYDELDSYLALQQPEDSSCILMAHRDGLAIAKGQVMEIENLTATVYSSLAHWLAANVK